MTPRTLLVSADYLDPERPGGSARMAWESARGLAGRGHLVRLAAGLPEPPPAHAEGTFRAEWFPYPPRGRFLPTRARRLAADVRRVTRACLGGVRPDAVIAQQPLTARWIADLPELRGVPIVYVFHSPWHREYELNAGIGVPDAAPPGLSGRLRIGIGGLIRRRWEGKIVREAARVLTLSDSMAREAVAAHGIPYGAIGRIPGGVDLGRFHPAAPQEGVRARLGLPTDGLLLLTARRLVPRMGLPTLVRAFAGLAADFPTARLALCGTGPLEERLRGQVAALGLAGRVTLCGHLPEELLPDALRSADLVVVPSATLEGFCLSMAEALACGVPVLATPVGGMAEVLSGFDRRCLAAGTDEAALAAGIRHLLGDAELRADLGRRGAAFAVERFGWPGVAARLEDEVGHVLGSRPGTAAGSA